MFKFKDMEIGKTYNTIALLTSVKEKTAKNGNAYLEMVLSDGSCNITARFFNCSESDLYGSAIAPGMIVDVDIKVDTYNEQKNYILNSIAEATTNDISVEDMVVSAPIDTNTTFLTLLLKLFTVSSHDITLEPAPISHLAMRLLQKNEKVFTHAAAAKSIHHAVIGGLLQHTFTMVDAVDKICETYPSLDKELLLAGAALHDIGKVRELETSYLGATEYTSEGRLLGHAAIGIMMVDEEAKNGGFNYDVERVKLLQHMIGAHHGNMQYGAIVEPAIPEAIVLHALDMIDSKGNVFDKAYESLESGQMSGKIFGLNGASAYKALDNR